MVKIWKHTRLRGKAHMEKKDVLLDIICSTFFFLVLFCIMFVHKQQCHKDKYVLLETDAF
jgi:hypothetical protein